MSQIDTADEAAVRALYQRVMDAWNSRSADAYASAFTENGLSIGFDGSQMEGRTQIASVLDDLFARHPNTHRHVSTVRDVRHIAPEVAVLRAVAGFVPTGGSDIIPELNALLVLTAVREDREWRIATFQNTPAQYHDQSMAEALTEELRALL